MSASRQRLGKQSDAPASIVLFTDGLGADSAQAFEDYFDAHPHQLIVVGVGGEDIVEGVAPLERRALEQLQGAADVGVDEGLTRMGADVGLVQGGGVQHRIDVLERAPREARIADRTHQVGVRRGQEIGAHRLVLLGRQGAHQRLSEVAAAAGILIGLIWRQVEWLAVAAGVGICSLMIGALLTHARVEDDAKETAPAGVIFVLSIVFMVLISLR